jgi:hypothetical protein
MIKLTTARKPAGAEPEVYINIDDIRLIQRQTPVDGTDFTAIFFITGGVPPYMVEERPEEVVRLIAEERKSRQPLRLR